jgi:hypothetical protein
MVDGWPEIEKKLYSPQLIFKKAVPAGSEAPIDPSSPIPTKEKMATEQELIYNLMDGRLTVQEIIDQSLLGKFNASEIMVNLMEMGWVEIAGVKTPNLMQKMGLVKFQEALPFVYYGAFLLLVSLVIAYVKPEVFHQLLESKIEHVDTGIPTHFIDKTRMDRVKNALMIYYLEKGSYPPQLLELVSAKLLEPGDLFHRQGVPYQYGLREEKYFLSY